MNDEGGDFHADPEHNVWGITRRNWLAGVVMQGLLSNPTTGHTSFDEANVVRSYTIADKMIEEGKRQR